MRGGTRRPGQRETTGGVTDISGRALIVYCGFRNCCVAANFQYKGTRLTDATDAKHPVACMGTCGLQVLSLRVAEAEHALSYVHTAERTQSEREKDGAG